ncbi:MAG: cysteine dioxygenase family protein [Phycisphaerales bacterium]
MPQLCTSKLEPLVEYLDSLTGRADLSTLEGLLADLDVSRADLEPVCTFKNDCYQRNRIKATTWYELVALCWRPGQKSQIHDHASSSCAFRVVEGTVTERRFEKLPDGKVRPVAMTTIRPGEICAAQDEAIHEVCNLSDTEDLVTLHIYSPPLNMRTYELGIGVYDEKGG